MTRVGWLSRARGVPVKAGGWRRPIIIYFLLLVRMRVPSVCTRSCGSVALALAIVACAGCRCRLPAPPLRLVRVAGRVRAISRCHLRAAGGAWCEYCLLYHSPRSMPSSLLLLPSCVCVEWCRYRILHRPYQHPLVTRNNSIPTQPRQRTETTVVADVVGRGAGMAHLSERFTLK